MAFQQPLVPVLPVARELISKTKWIASKSTAVAIEHGLPPKSAPPRAITVAPHDHDNDEPEGRRSSSSSVDLRTPPSAKNGGKHLTGNLNLRPSSNLNL